MFDAPRARSPKKQIPINFFTNQWRADFTAFSAEEFTDFDRFVAPFRFVKPSFYETL